MVGAEGTREKLWWQSFWPCWYLQRAGTESGHPLGPNNPSCRRLARKYGRRRVSILNMAVNTGRVCMVKPTIVLLILSAMALLFVGCQSEADKQNAAGAALGNRGYPSQDYL